MMNMNIRKALIGKYYKESKGENYYEIWLWLLS